MVDPTMFGVSFSVKQCWDLGVEPRKVLEWLIIKGFRRFRLMSYWDEIEKTPGIYDFTELDRQFARISDVAGIVSLCLGARQPRYPENHWPSWAWELPAAKRNIALQKFIETVVMRYKNNKYLVSYQLENEALNRSFGERGEFDRKRLSREYKLVKRLDPTSTIIMTTSNSWGLPFRRPIPQAIGFSLYRSMNFYGKQTSSKLPVWSYILRAFIARGLLGRRSFIHELQAEPWGPKAIWEMTIDQQNESMSPKQIAINIGLARKTKLYPIDLWGGEWWYWRAIKHKDPSIWSAVQKAIDS